MDRAIAHLHKIKLVLHHFIFAQDKSSSTSFYKTEVYATTRKYDNHWQDLSGKTSKQKLAESGLSDWNPISAKSYFWIRPVSMNASGKSVKMNALPFRADGKSEQAAPFHH